VAIKYRMGEGIKMPMNIWAVALTFLLCLDWGSAFAFEAETLQQIDTEIEHAIADGKLPGGVLWLEAHGSRYIKSYGQRALEPEKEPITEDTIYDAASLTKIMATAPAIAILIERGTVKLDEPAHTYIPEFTGEKKELITIRQLLTHTSGLRPDLSLNDAWAGYEKGIELACAEKLAHPSGTEFVYSDINFIVLGEVVHRVSGMALNEFCAKEIYQPLKMTDTCFLPPAEKLSRIAPTQRTGTTILRRTVHDPTSRRMGGVAGHAGVFTTASDLARYARMMLNGGELDGVRILKPDTVKLMTSVQSPEGIEDKRGIGWDIHSGYSRPRGHFSNSSYGHTGFTGTCIWIDPEAQAFWILLSNRVHPDGKGNILPLQGK